MGKALAAGLLGTLVTLAYFGFAPQIGRVLHHPGVETRYRALDFTIFYCGGSAVLAGANPYTIEPLTSCERRYWPAAYLPGFSEPVAFPGPTLALFAALAMLPYRAAAIVWLLALCLCFGIAVIFGSLLSRAPPFGVLALLFVPIALINIGVGQLAPIFAAAVFASAYFARRGRDRLAACCALAAAIEPHIGLPVIVALFVLAPRTRLTLGLGALALAALHVALLGPELARSYVTSVLPAQAHAEYVAADQFGSIWWLKQLGLADRAIPLASTFLYAVALALGIALAARARARTGDRAFIVAIPLALALLATPYLHDVELGVALAAPLAALARTARDPRILAGAVVLAVPWFAAARSPALAGTSLACAILFVAACTLRRDIRTSEPALATALLVAILLEAAARLPIVPGDLTPASALGKHALAATSWAQWIRSQPLIGASGPRTVLPKLLSIGGLIVVVL